MSNNNRNTKGLNYKKSIIKNLSKFTTGLTITDLSNIIEGNRNTVSKYLSILEAEGKVYKKKIGPASLYFSKKRKYLQKQTVSSFIRSLIYAFREIYPENKEKMKQIGRKVMERFQFPLGNLYFREITKKRALTNPRAYLELFEEFYNEFDFFENEFEIYMVELDDKYVKYQFKNPEMLNNSEENIYFFYIMCGIAEILYKQNFDLDILCQIEDVHISETKKDSFLTISITIK
jgi:DNA-binding transcriptional regulator YhcF (GntR family)